MESLCDAVFLNYAGDAIGERGVRKIVAKYVQAAGISKKVSPHSLHYAFAIEKAEKGVSTYRLQGWLGHANLNTTQVYVHLAKQPGGKVMEQTYSSIQMQPALLKNYRDGLLQKSRSLLYTARMTSNFQRKKQLDAKLLAIAVTTLCFIGTIYYLQYKEQECQAQVERTHSSLNLCSINTQWGLPTTLLLYGIIITAVLIIIKYLNRE